ncbi:hypothetical protein TrRE_jg9703 [Triparma retinervis]|uniref:Scaffold protein Nfu/NifU N-terminal domain-containing protein n=1 Tax=Triparma retinervis TaxID=2557542 RepID=A0A9W7AR60_9STRA|nr:hypothetical protein TrRE_jg9703 [Triparma retinervis]
MLSSLSRLTANTRKTVPIISHSIRSIFIQTSETPNPASLKFLPGRPVYETSDDRGFFVQPRDTSAVRRSPLAASILRSSDGISGVYIGSDFVTVTKTEQVEWEEVRTGVFECMMDHFADPDAVAVEEDLELDEEEISDTTILDDDSEVVAMIKELLEVRIRPAVQEDGGDIKLVEFVEETGVVRVRLEGSCVGCPSSSVTLKSGVENMLQHYIPEVTAVEAVDDGGETVGVGGAIEVDTWASEKESKEREDDGKPKMTYEERLAAAGIPLGD